MPTCCIPLWQILKLLLSTLRSFQSALRGFVMCFRSFLSLCDTSCHVWNTCRHDETLPIWDLPAMFETLTKLRLFLFETLPDDVETLPNTFETLLELHETLHDLCETFPDMFETCIYLFETLPDKLETFWHNGTFPTIRDCCSQFETQKFFLTTFKLFLACLEWFVIALRHFLSRCDPLWHVWGSFQKIWETSNVFETLPDLPGCLGCLETYFKLGLMNMRPFLTSFCSFLTFLSLLLC